MSSVLTNLSWTERAERWDRLVEKYEAEGNERDATFARANAGTCRLMAIEDEEVDCG